MHGSNISPQGDFQSRDVRELSCTVFDVNESPPPIEPSAGSDRRTVDPSMDERPIHGPGVSEIDPTAEVEATIYAGSDAHPVTDVLVDLYVDSNIESPEAVISDMSEVGPVVTERTAGRRLLGRRSKIFLLAFVAAMLGILPFQQSSYVLVQPGPVLGIEFTSGAGAEPPAAADTWSFTTIAVKRLNWLELTIEQLRNPANVFPSAGTSSQPAATAQMAAAKLTAAGVADYLLYNLSTPTSWVITSLIPGTAAARYGLEVNDRIVAANGEQIDSVGELRSLLDAAPVTLQILRGKQTVQITVDVEGRGVLGVELAPVGLPQRIDAESIRTEDVGGGSAGLMFTLALLDNNSEGDLSGGKKIAGTGTINPDGTVGPIVGASYKFEAAEEAGVGVFFVPTTLRDQLPDHSKVEIVPVDDVVDAVRWLCAHGGRSPQLCRN